MANLTDRYEQKVLDGLTGVAPLTTPAIVYLALFTADPTETGSVANEVSGGGYARVSLAAAFPAAAGASVSNSGQIDFPAATADWPSVTHMGLVEADVEGVADMMVHIALDAPIVILNTEIFSINVSDFTLTAD